MPHIRFDFGKQALDADLFDTPTANAVLVALPISASALTWGEEVYFDVPGRPRKGRSRDCHARRDRLCPFFALSPVVS
jgi:hypothetical protein